MLSSKEIFLFCVFYYHRTGSRTSDFEGAGSIKPCLNSKAPQIALKWLLRLALVLDAIESRKTACAEIAGLTISTRRQFFVCSNRQEQNEVIAGEVSTAE